MSDTPVFNKVAILGMGLIGSSIARALKKHGLAGSIVGGDGNQAVCDRAVQIGLAEAMTTDMAAAVAGADLVVMAVPVGACGAVASSMAPGLAPGAIVTDVGSVKKSVLNDVAQHLPKGVQFIPGHPLAGTEHSGPDAGFAELFEGRYWILTPEDDVDPAAVERLKTILVTMGAQVETMTPEHHDRVLAITSHLPHLIAYTIVGTATDLAEETKNEVIRYSATGFRDFTRIAASDPVMWRDVFLNNREAVLEILQRFTEDLTALQRAIRWGEGDVLEKRFTETRAIRRGVLDAKQAD
ncbi:MAG: cyclohexadienyl dehydrogenase [Alphaproteobacteria bacterium]|nr:cyclohexadienyl dehydrogenase [Alphaproteobacteria bacterium]MAS46681.1 cyclohexadienyl dehydrogenase [Alphaproteobacteria bacterium]MBN53772.1 cyclohexadienyl dehydrogenase [Alphaproteobacteria bacterium]OUT41740.1 MAG: cyclohexadienyl dehydrogenase [Micavibrio sp. TMED2]|tara:strand:+ start:2629 stop:3519 length:891 start_codon:yes stop_codon:yes gene_type:complete